MNVIDKFVILLRESNSEYILPNDYIHSLEEELHVFIDRLIKYKSPDTASCVLDELGDFQEKLALMLFKYKVPLSEQLEYIVRHYDRPDDPDARKFIFEYLCKSGSTKL